MVHNRQRMAAYYRHRATLYRTIVKPYCQPHGPGCTSSPVEFVVSGLTLWKFCLLFYSEQIASNTVLFSYHSVYFLCLFLFSHSDSRVFYRAKCIEMIFEYSTWYFSTRLRGNDFLFIQHSITYDIE